MTSNEKNSFLEQRLYENGIDFINKSMESFVLASNENQPIEYKYAILLLATGAEIILKSILEDVHPLFIRENLDGSSKVTVKAENLVSRINSVYSSMNVSKRIQNVDENNLSSIRKLRNDIIHKEFKFEDKKFAEKLYANTLFTLDRIVKEFKNLTLSSEVTNWGYIVNIEPIQRAYYNSVKGISFDGLAVPCSFCSIKKLVNKDNLVECLHCGNRFDNIMEAINSLDDMDLIEELFNAFSREKFKNGMHFMDCPSCHEVDYAWYDNEKQAVICFNCDIVSTETCPKCHEDSVIMYLHEFKSGLEEEHYCFNCEGNPHSEACPNCYEDYYQLKEMIRIDVKKPDEFYSNVALRLREKELFINASLCPNCYELMERLEQEGMIVIM